MNNPYSTRNLAVHLQHYSGVETLKQNIPHQKRYVGKQPEATVELVTRLAYHWSGKSSKYNDDKDDFLPVWVNRGTVCMKYNYTYLAWLGCLA
ncbi:hypothetical protein T4B_6834 [Trichinella pseudospiralis]|uniref:Uncharacterized protein n=1 Tax=Trichinella pseudospiralis TaxID=6337 RepID=A0A0V1K9X8_TRIPS|nr:hypothetical protein T4B_6834 [Trichinella pseudospiralis]KRZ44009.1 hypothetical protein T4C_11729 [Trichinella pseudospiralis]